MIVVKRIMSGQDETFRKLMELYVEAFPLEERREIAQLEKMLETEPAMCCNAVECDGVLAGLLVYWDFDTFYYLEHLAVFAEMRDKKIGQRILDWIDGHLGGVRILEVEPDDTEIAARRIQYYRRNGYRILDKSYIQPSYRPGGEGCPLWIMGNVDEQPREVLDEEIRIIKNRVYKKNCCND